MPRRRLRLSEALWDSFVLSQVPRTREISELRRQRLSAGARLAAWRRWHREKALQESHAMVEKIARTEARHFAPWIDIRDLIQAGFVGLLDAARRYHPDAGAFERYAWFRVRGAIIDSQKRRTYREELNPSLQAISEANGGWLPPALDTSSAPDPEAAAIQAERRERLYAAIAALAETDKQLILAQLNGASMGELAELAGHSITWTRARLAEVKHVIARKVKFRK